MSDKHFNQVLHNLLRSHLELMKAVIELGSAQSAGHTFDAKRYRDFMDNAILAFDAAVELEKSEMSNVER